MVATEVGARAPVITPMSGLLRALETLGVTRIGLLTPYLPETADLVARHLESHGIEPTTFIPPWHEYDRTTVRVLAENGFDCINEGRWPIPRTVEGITLVPTHIPAITPYMIGAGVMTIVSHPQLDDYPMSSADAVVGHEDRVKTPSEIVDWWHN